MTWVAVKLAALVTNMPLAKMSLVCERCLHQMAWQTSSNATCSLDNQTLMQYLTAIVWWSAAAACSLCIPSNKIKPFEGSCSVRACISQNLLDDPMMLQDPSHSVCTKPGLQKALDLIQELRFAGVWHHRLVTNDRLCDPSRGGLR